jgi:hypothetical protein
MIARTLAAAAVAAASATGVHAGQTPTPQAAFAFEAASVKPNREGVPAAASAGSRADGSTLSTSRCAR